MTGFRIDVSKMRRKVEALKAIPATVFKPEVMDFTRKGLAKASTATPVRDKDVITDNQAKQWAMWRGQGGSGISRRDFIASRLPARFLYKASWGQVARSLGLYFSESADVLSAHTRRNPEEDPPKGYGQYRGGKTAFSVVIYNPFLETKSRYKNFTGKEIIGDAMESGKEQFQKRVDAKMRRVVYAIMHSNN